jgi:antidote-toxin recognition MazE-like antitoxin
MPPKTKPRKTQRRKAKPLTSREKVRAHRARLRAKGLRPITLWVPGTRTKAFAAQAHRESLLAAKSPTEKEDQTFIESIARRGE